MLSIPYVVNVYDSSHTLASEPHLSLCKQAPSPSRPRSRNFYQVLTCSMNPLQQWCHTVHNDFM